jgi:hypothetical protein
MPKGRRGKWYHPPDRRILEFTTSEHFLKQMWERRIPKTWITEVLIKCTQRQSKYALIATPEFWQRLKNNGHSIPEKKVDHFSLVVVAHERLLITVHWCPDPLKWSKAQHKKGVEIQWIT